VNVSQLRLRSDKFDDDDDDNNIWGMIVYLNELVTILRIKTFHSVLEVKENISLYTPCSCVGGMEV
jgi:hypothetical protein